MHVATGSKEPNGNFWLMTDIRAIIHQGEQPWYIVGVIRAFVYSHPEPSRKVKWWALQYRHPLAATSLRMKANREERPLHSRIAEGLHRGEKGEGKEEEDWGRERGRAENCEGTGWPSIRAHVLNFRFVYRVSPTVPDLRGFVAFRNLHVLHDYFYRETKNDNDLLVNFIPEEWDMNWHSCDI